MYSYKLKYDGIVLYRIDSILQVFHYVKNNIDNIPTTPNYSNKYNTTENHPILNQKLFKSKLMEIMYE